MLTKPNRGMGIGVEIRKGILDLNEIGMSIGIWIGFGMGIWMGIKIGIGKYKLEL